MHKVFITYHHDNDQYYKNSLVTFAQENDIFIDSSVDTGDVPDELPDNRIREIISPHFPSIVDIQCGEKAILL